MPHAFGLPHREPFVFVDEVASAEAGSARCVKTFSPGDPMFRGHFPGNPIVPGVILTEALAQTAGIAGAAGNPEKRFLLSAIRSMKFPSPARPGERIDLSAQSTGTLGKLAIFTVRAAVGARVVAEGQIVLNESAE